jgi:hypothetical protein
MAGLFEQFNRIAPNSPQQGTWDAGTLYGTRFMPTTGSSIPGEMWVEKGLNEIGHRTDLQGNYRGANLPNYVLAHEQEHIQQNRAEDRYKKTMHDVWNDNLNKAYDIKDPRALGFDHPYWSFSKNLQSKSVRERLKELGAGEDAYLMGKAAKTSTNELFASLSGLEEAKRIDLTKDPILRKELFNNDIRMIEAYKASTGLRLDRLDARDLSPSTPQVPRQPTTIESLKNIVFGTGFEPSIK